MSLKRLKLARLLVGVLLLKPLYAEDMQFFNEGLNYWGEQKKEPQSPAKAPIAATEANIDDKKFPWEHFLDPKNKEFFREGDYTPPEPFMELVRNPSDENIKMWFSYMDKKNELAQRLSEKVALYAEKNGLGAAEKEQMRVNIAPKTSKNLDIQRYRIRMYFSSTCPHCQKMMGTLRDLQEKGFFIETKQIDPEKGLAHLPFPVSPATKAELNEKSVQAVPLLLVGDLKSKVIYRLSGYQSTESVLAAIQSTESEVPASKN